jgi:DNA polymerase III subunit gamma/tau
MENFIVSARKYRPQTFDTVVGQSPISSTLKNAIRTNHLAQAYLFCGPRGVGKTTCARILAKTINCFHRTQHIEACDECESCKSFNAGHSLNIYELDAASNNSVDDIRNLINQVSFAPQIGTHKVYIIDEVHMLSQQAFNAFLKTLEEPPKHAIFILATTEKHKIIPTILSRCQVFDFNRIRIEDTVAHLASIAEKEKVKAEEDALHVIAQKSDGAMRDALSIFDQLVSLSGDSITYKSVIENLSILDYDYYFKVTDALLEKNTSASLLLFNEILNKGFDGHNFLNGLAAHLRNLLVCQDESTLQLMEVSGGVRERYKTQSKKTVLDFLLNGLTVLNKADVQYKTSRNQRLLVELTLLQLCSSQRIETILEKKNEIADKEPRMPESRPYPVPAAAIKTVAEPGTGVKNEPPIIAAAPAPGLAKTNPGKAPVKSMLSIASMTGGNIDTKNTGKPPLSPAISNTEAKDLQTVWNNFTESIKKKNKINLFSTLTARKPVQEDETTLSFSVSNQVQEDEINMLKTDLVVYLRSEMKNPALQFKIIVDKITSEKKPYTGEEKFQHMVEKNPALHKLRQQFNLEIDY